MLLLPLQASKYMVCGRLIDSVTGKALESATVEMLKEDSTVIESTITNINEDNDKNSGCFYFNVPDDLSPSKGKVTKIIIRSRLLGYKTTCCNAEIKNKRIFSLNVGNIEMQRDNRMLKEVIVKGTKIKMVTRGDTIIYNADAFRLAEGSMLDALVSQMPGIEIKENGDIFSNGDYVNELLLDGRKFFSGNPKVALENLPAYTVSKVKVYKKSGDLSKLMQRDMKGDKKLVLDVYLKREYSMGWVVNGEMAAGTKERYLARLFGLRFTDISRLAVFSNINNTNDNRRPGRNGDWDPADMPEGLQRSKTAGLSYSFDERKDKFYFETNNTISHVNGNNFTQTSQQTYLNQGSNYTRAVNSMSSKQTDINSQNGFRLSFKKMLLNTSLNINYHKYDGNSMRTSALFSDNPKLSFDVLDSVYSGNMSTSLAGITLNRLRTVNVNTNEAFNTSANVSTRIRNGADYFSFESGINYDHARNQSRSLYMLDFLQMAGEGMHQYQRRNNPTSGYQYNIGAEYVYYLGKDENNHISPSYKYQQKYHSDDNPFYTADIDSTTTEMLPSKINALTGLLNEGNSYHYNQLDRNHQLGINLTYDKMIKNMTVLFSTDLPLRITNQRLNYYRKTDYSIHSNNLFFEPSFALNIFKGYPNKFMNLIYIRGSLTSQSPSLVDMINYTDDSNPLLVKTGNPNLKNVHTGSFMTLWQLTTNKHHQMFSLNTNFSSTDNAIANGFVFDRNSGITTYKPQNVDGNWNLNVPISYNRDLDKNGSLTMKYSFTSNYRHSVDLVNMEKSKVNTATYGNKLQLDYDLSAKVKLGAMFKSNSSHITSGRADFHTINATDFNYGVNSIIDLPWHIQLSTDLTMYSHRGYTDRGMNTNDLIWNARLTTSTLKGHLLFTLDGFDMLSQLSNRRYSVDSQGRTETWTNSIPRYVMLHMTYKFNKNPKKK